MTEIDMGSSQQLVESGIQEYDSEHAGHEISERLRELVETRSEGFVGYFMQTEQCHIDAEANFLQTLGVEKPDTTTSAQRQLVAKFGNIGLFLTPQWYDGSEVAIQYDTERLPRQRRLLSLLKLT